MKNSTNTLKQLRQLMKQKFPQDPISAYVITNHDSHMSEYLENADKRLQFITGFSGSAGTAIVTMNEALLWTDGRYYVQALEELDDNWTLMKTGLACTPSESTWLSTNLPKLSRIGTDPKLIPYKMWLEWEKELAKNGHTLVPVEENFIDLCWKNKPAFSSKPINIQPIQFSGVERSVKIKDVKAKMIEKEADILIINALDEIAWLLNLRGSDISYNPVFFSYLVITQDVVHLFVDNTMLPQEFLKSLGDSENAIIQIHPYLDIFNFITDKILSDSIDVKKVWIPMNMNYYIYSLIPAKKRVCECSPILLMKALKNEIEIQGMIKSHLKDGIALSRFYAWLEKEVPKGSVTEISAAEKLETFRQDEENYMGPSFTTISSSGPHNAIIHYQPSPKTDRKLSCDELYLCDSGAQYLDGTTDVTRTVHFGNPTDFEKDCFTRVFKGQTALANTIFPTKLKGNNLDSIPRRALWNVGLDYMHGTSHGVGSFLHVHEGPIGISWRDYPDDPGLQPNMILSNEPGYYHEKEFGIRLENIVQVVPATTVHNFQNIGYLTFKTLTLVPVQQKMLKPELLTQQEVDYLNSYHQTCRDEVGTVLKERGYKDAYDWLMRETQVLG